MPVPSNFPWILNIYAHTKYLSILKYLSTGAPGCRFWKAPHVILLCDTVYCFRCVKLLCDMGCCFRCVKLLCDTVCCFRCVKLLCDMVDCFRCVKLLCVMVYCFRCVKLLGRWKESWTGLESSHLVQCQLRHIKVGSVCTSQLYRYALNMEWKRLIILLNFIRF